MNDTPGSHWQGLALLNVVRVTDIPEVVGALAPRRLVFLTRVREAFEYARKIYQLQGDTRQFVQLASAYRRRWESGNTQASAERLDARTMKGKRTPRAQRQPWP